MAKQFVEGGISHCVLALGFEKMEKGSLPVKGCSVNPLARHMSVMHELRGASDAPPAAQMFGNAGREHMEKHGTKAASFARIGAKNHRHSVNNPYAQFQTEFSMEEVCGSPVIS